LLAIIAFARPATAQIDVALSPFPVQQQPVGYQTFGDGSGGVWAVFQGAQSGAALYAQHVLANGAYAAGFGPAARQVAHSGTLVNSISAAPDGLGGALVVWFGVNPLDSTSQSVALRAQHLDAQGTNQYPDSGLVVSSIASAAMAVGDGQGGLYVAWEELKSPTNPDIVAQHFGNFGDPLWSPSGSPTGRNVCAVVGIQRLRAIQEDGAGGAYVAWADSRVPGTVPLYGMRLTPGGVAAAPWPANGVQLTPLTSGIRIVGSAGAPGGGIWVAWRDINVGGQFAAQHLAADGSLRCAAAGALVAAVSVTRADLVPATSGDVFVTWSGADIRCQRLDSTGTRMWPEISGRVMVSPPSPPITTRAATDGAGGQRLAWSFDNGGQTDVNVLRVDGTGAPWPGEPPLGDSFAATPLADEPVAWLRSETSTPQTVWLSGGILEVRLTPTSASVGREGPLGGVALAPPAPNPLRGGLLTLRFSAAAGPARLELFDAAGRRVLARALFSQGGAQSVRFDEAARLAPGVYTLRLSASGVSASRRLVRIE
jgi:hypothetical protein